MKEANRLRFMAAKARRLAGGVSDATTLAMLKAYASECCLDADVREADIDNAVWIKPLL